MFDPKKAGEEADQLIASLNQPPAEDQGTTEDAIPANQDIDTTEGTTEVAVSQESQPETQRDDAALEVIKKQLDAAEQRWKVLQGMIDKKDSEIEQMRGLFAQMQSAPQAEDQGVKADKLDFSKESDEFGADWVAAIERVASAVADRSIKLALAQFKPQSVQKLESDVASVQRSVADSAYDRFTSNLTTKVADWEQLNTDPGFLGWLNQIDDFVGVDRLSLLRDAFSKADAGRVARFFNAYKDEAGLTKQAEPAPQPAANVTKFVSPGKSSRSSAAKVESGSSKQWSRADISRLYDDKMRGKITQSVFEEQERDLFNAQREGRVAA